MKVAQAFAAYKTPKGSIAVRCHVLKDEERAALIDFCVGALPGCYITQALLRERVKATGKTAAEILANKLPDPGSVMSGDFGEMLTLYFLATERAEEVAMIKKWRFKQDRKKPAPHSDVIVLHRESEDKASANDFVINAESKQKSTKGSFAPIAKAIEGVTEDQTGRLGRTLAWLREKAIDHGSKKEIALIERFTHELSVGYAKHYKAVAVIDRNFLDHELMRQPSPKINGTFEVVVIGIKDLKEFYETVFGRAVKEVKA